MRRLQILLMSLLIFSSCNDTHYATGVGLMGITGLAAYPIKKPLEAVFADGTDDFYEQLAKSRKTESKNENLREILSCRPKAGYPLKRPSEENLKRFIKATEKKSCLGCVPWEIFTHVRRLKN